jgi:hypothetical protein
MAEIFLKDIKCWRGCGEIRSPSYTAGGNVKLCSLFGKQSGIFSKELT